MLIDFSIKNYKSIKDEVHLNMVYNEPSSQSDKEVFTRFTKIDTVYGTSINVCPIMALFGPNASGKSNLLKALATMRAIVMRGFVENYYDPFCFSENKEKAPTEFVLIFADKDKDEKYIVYEYGIEYDATGIIREYLNRIGKEQDTTIFDTNVFDSLPLDVWHLFITNRIPITNIVNRPDFNTDCFKEKNIDLNDLSKVKNFFENLFVADDINLFPMPKENITDTLNKLFYRMDMSFKNIEIQLSDEFDEFYKFDNDENIYSSGDSVFININKLEKKKQQFSQKHPDCLVTFDIDKKNNQPLFYAHKISMIYDKEQKNNETGTKIINYMTQESTGTKNLFRFLCVLIDAIKTNKIIVFDEIDRTIHTELIKFIFNLVHDKLGAQLICSSHNPYAMSNLGKYEIGIINRGQDLSTKVDFLSNFNFKDANPNFAEMYAHRILGGVPRVINVFDNIEV